MTKGTNQRKSNNKPETKVINAKKVDPKWFVYVPNDGSSRYKAQFEPAPEVAPTKREMTKEIDCISMFLEGCRTTLGFCLGM